MNCSVVLAAGKGSRMNYIKNKCVYPILEKPLIKYIYDTLKNFNLKKICVIGDKYKDILDLNLEEFKYVKQEKQLGTADALLTAINLIDDDGYTIILSGDTFIYDEVLNKLIDFHLKNNNDLSLLTNIKEYPYGYGRIFKKNNKICKIIEENECTNKQKKIKEVNLGIYCINNKVLKDNISKIKKNYNKKEYYLTDLIYILNDKYKIDSLNINDQLIMGINKIEEAILLESLLKNKINNDLINNGVKIIDINNTIISSDTFIDSGCVIYPGSILIGNNIIGKNNIIGPNTYINDSNIKNNNKIIYSYIINSNIENNNNIGPFTHIKDNSLINDNNRIGNFVEIKKTNLGNNNKVAHLTYIGDAIIGDNNNFGCGSIIVNYDGEKKNKTIIGNNNFIGSNCNIIAPIKLSNNTYIACGSSVSLDLEDNDFFIERSKEIIKKNYNSKYNK